MHCWHLIKTVMDSSMTPSNSSPNCKSGTILTKTLVFKRGSSKASAKQGSPVSISTTSRPISTSTVTSSLKPANTPIRQGTKNSPPISNSQLMPKIPGSISMTSRTSPSIRLQTSSRSYAGADWFMTASSATTWIRSLKR